MTDTVYLVTCGNTSAVFSNRALAEAYAKSLVLGSDGVAKRWECEDGEVYFTKYGSASGRVWEYDVRTTEFWLKEPSDE